MVSVTIHRGTNQIGGTCIELRNAKGERLILDAGRPLDAPRGATGILPASLDLSETASVLICHAHQDHWGLVDELPGHWPVHAGASSAKLIAITAHFARTPLRGTIIPWRSRGRFRIGDYTITPILTDHSAFDAYMLLIETGDSRILYSGDFRRHGRKSDLVDQMIAAPPPNLDLLILEGTNLGTAKPTMTEAELENRFVDLIDRTPGRVFVTWSGQNIDRTVTLFRAARRRGRSLAVDLYTAEVLEELAPGTRLPRPGFDNFKVVLTAGLRRHYADLGRHDFIDRMARCGIGAARLEGSNHVVMLRDGLVRDYQAKGVTPSVQDAWSYSMWRGYLEGPSEVRDWIAGTDTHVEHLHTSGHASAGDLRDFARAMNARMILPVHGQNWDTEMEGFERVTRSHDGQTVTV